MQYMSEFFPQRNKAGDMKAKAGKNVDSNFLTRLSNLGSEKLGTQMFNFKINTSYIMVCKQDYVNYYSTRKSHLTF